MEDQEPKLYDKSARPSRLEPYFSRHMLAMTVEDLHDKGDIAIELARRDMKYDLLVKDFNRFLDAAEQVLLSPGWRGPLGVLQNAVDHVCNEPWRERE